MISPMDTDIILSSEGKHDLRAVPFSRRGAFLCVLEDDEDRQLYLSLSRSPNMWMQRKNLICLTPMCNNHEIPYEYVVTPGKLIITTYAGRIELCLSGDGTLRIRGRGAHLRLSFEMMLFENCVSRENGDIEVSINVLGKLLLVPLKGAIFCNGQWSPSKSRADDFIVELIPPVETDSYEIAIHEFYTNGARLPDYAPFDDCAMDATADFERFQERFPNVSGGYASIARLAAWVIWTHTLGPSGMLAHEVVYMTRTQWLRAFGWQQSYQAMAASGDIRAAWQLLLTMFDYQDEAGQIPDSVGDLGAAYMVSKPALQGLTLDYLLKRCDLEQIPREDCAKLYDKLTRYADWWLVCRDRSGSGLPQYYHSDESPGEFCQLFGAGLPMHTGDLTAFVALLSEACGRLAECLGDGDHAMRWMNKSRYLIKRLVDELWNGRMFLSRVVKTGQLVESDSFMGLLPIILASRLPDNIIDTLAGRLSDESEYLSPGGITIESMRTDGNDANLPGPRGAAVYVSTLMCIGLDHAGKKDLARNIAARCCQSMAATGFTFMPDPTRMEEACETTRLGPKRKKPSKTNRWSSWIAACFIILANLLDGQ